MGQILLFVFIDCHSVTVQFTFNRPLAKNVVSKILNEEHLWDYSSDDVTINIGSFKMSDLSSICVYFATTIHSF